MAGSAASGTLRVLSEVICQARHADRPCRRLPAGACWVATVHHDGGLRAVEGGVPRISAAAGSAPTDRDSRTGRDFLRGMARALRRRWLSTAAYDHPVQRLGRTESEWLHDGPWNSLAIRDGLRVTKHYREGLCFAGARAFAIVGSVRAIRRLFERFKQAGGEGLRVGQSAGVCRQGLAGSFRFHHAPAGCRLTDAGEFVVHGVDGECRGRGAEDVSGREEIALNFAFACSMAGYVSGFAKR